MENKGFIIMIIVVLAIAFMSSSLSTTGYLTQNRINSPSTSQQNTFFSDDSGLPDCGTKIGGDRCGGFCESPFFPGHYGECKWDPTASKIEDRCKCIRTVSETLECVCPGLQDPDTGEFCRGTIEDSKCFLGDQPMTGSRSGSSCECWDGVTYCGEGTCVTKK